MLFPFSCRASRLLLLLLLLLFPLTLLAGQPSRADAQEYGRLSREVAQFFQNHDYAQAAEKCRAQIALLPTQADGHYNLACALARQGKTDEAFQSLTKAIELGFTDVAHIRQDTDLDSLRQDKRMAETLDKARQLEKTSGYERGAEIKGVKTVEDYPEGGLRYRLRMSENASEQKPDRLIIWLHPSGGSMNNIAESLAPLLTSKGFALLVLTKKQFMGWTGPEAELLLNKTLPEVAKIKGLDVKRPLLLGYSAGGQMALQLWKLNPEGFGGLILDAAYPIEMDRSLLKLPENEAIRTVPLLVLVGDQDGGAQVWKKAEPVFRAAGVPLVVDYVPGQGHTWLFGKAQLERLSQWLQQVREGKLPGKEVKAPEAPKAADKAEPKLSAESKDQPEPRKAPQVADE